MNIDINEISNDDGSVKIYCIRFIIDIFSLTLKKPVLQYSHVATKIILYFLKQIHLKM